MGSNFKKFLAHRLCHQHRGSHIAGKDHIQEKSCVGKSGAKKDLVGKILTKEKLDASKILAKKELVSGLVPISKTVPIAKNVSAGSRSRQGPRQEGMSDLREQYQQVQRQAGGTRARRRPDKAASPDRKGQRVVSKPFFWTETQQMKAEPNSSKVESSGQQEQKKEQRRGAPQLEHSWQHREMVPRQTQTKAREKPRPELEGAAQPREGNKKPSGARIRRYKSLPQGTWSRLKREASNLFNMLKAANTARRHTAGTQILEKGHTELGPATRRQEAQGGGPRAVAGWSQGRAGQSRQPGQKGTRQLGELQALTPPYAQ